MDSVIENLDFSENSWFDLWHTHVDWDGAGNENWEVRLSFLNKLVATYEAVKEKLQKYPNNFQIWIMISEFESTEDTIYIHTPNPNSKNYPFKIEEGETPTFLNQQLGEFLQSSPLDIVVVRFNGRKYFYLFDKRFGESIA